MDRKAQLGVIEFKFFLAGFFVGLIGALIFILLGTKKVIPLEIPFVCGSFFHTKKGQLGPIEFKFFMIGLIIGIIAALITIALGSHGVLPVKVPAVCG